MGTPLVCPEDLVETGTTSLDRGSGSPTVGVRDSVMTSPDPVPTNPTREEGSKDERDSLRLLPYTDPPLH